MFAQARAALLLLVYLSMVILAPPGLDLLGKRTLSNPNQVAEARRRSPAPWVVSLGVVIADLNRQLRMPVVDALAPLQAPLRISQDWSLYRDAPAHLCQFEVRVDGQVQYLSNDRQATWQKSFFKSRKIRPMLGRLTLSGDSLHLEGLTRHIGHRVEQDFPGARRLEFRVWEVVPPLPERSLRYLFEAEAPGWSPRAVEVKNSHEG